jgi:hypothetical protein
VDKHFMRPSRSVKRLITIRGQAEAVATGHRTTFVLSNWTSDHAEPTLPESIPTRTASWLVPPPFEGRAVEVVGHMGRLWHKYYFEAQSVHILQMGYTVKRINYHRLFVVLALLFLAMAGVVFYPRLHDAFVAVHKDYVSARSYRNFRQALSTLNGKDLYLCGGAHVDSKQKGFEFPRLTPLKVVGLAEENRAGLLLRAQDRIMELSVGVPENWTDLDSVLSSSYAYTAVPRVFTEDELKHIRSRTIFIGMSRRALDCAVNEPFFEDPGVDMGGQDVSALKVKVSYNSGRVISIEPLLETNQ